MVTSGWASRLWYQAGLVGAPPLEAKTNRRSPSRRYITGWVRGWPLFAPVVVSSSRGRPFHMPPTLPPLARNSSIILRFQSFLSGIILLYSNIDADRVGISLACEAGEMMVSC